VPGDITDRKTAERAISEGVARFGHIDTLINNAGIFVAKPFTQYTGADYAAALGVNLVQPVERHAQLAKLHPLGRMGEISDIVGAVLYLESASCVTGETIHVDGGQSAGH
jgi:NAD(P)-dependent dehydrogenase (short-subunit alcohol dehydrogenase family)